MDSRVVTVRGKELRPKWSQEVCEALERTWKIDAKSEVLAFLIEEAERELKDTLTKEEINDLRIQLGMEVETN